MSFMSESALPDSLDPIQAVGLAYATELAEIATTLQQGQPCLIECERELMLYVFLQLRDRVRRNGLSILLLDGRTVPEEEPILQRTYYATLVSQIRAIVTGSIEKRILVIPHFDLLMTSPNGLSPEGREVIPLLYENPEFLWIGFKDPSSSLPRPVESLVPNRFRLLGIPRDRLSQMMTKRDRRKFAEKFHPNQLYRYVSGMNPIRLRQLLTILSSEDNPPDSRPALDHFRKASLSTQLSVPSISLNDIAGYLFIKDRLHNDFLSILELHDVASDSTELSRLEAILPRGIVLSGPSGVGKTMFAHALAHELGAALFVATGPELKSRFLGGSEENIRHLFFRARQSAPSVILFEEIDNFASTRETKNSTGVEASMLIQLLSELDRLRPEELVFIIGTTQRKEAIDNSLLRPGRLELLVEIPLPNPEDRKAILELYDKHFDLQMDRMAIKKAVNLSEGNNTSCERLTAICRSLARMRIRHQRTDSTNIPDVESAFEIN